MEDKSTELKDTNEVFLYKDGAQKLEGANAASRLVSMSPSDQLLMATDPERCKTNVKLHTHSVSESSLFRLPWYLLLLSSGATRLCFEFTYLPLL